MRGAIAAGHPLTAAAGASVLREGGNAVDALLAAAFTAFVTEGPLTGPAGGGFALVHDPDAGTIVLDCFFAAPAARLGEMEEVLIDFGDSGTQVFHVGPGSVAVPGLLAGLEEAHCRFATREWADLVAPAVDLAHEGFERDEPRAFLHRILGPILLAEDGGRRIYGAEAHVVTEDCCATLERVRDAGSAVVAELIPEFAEDARSYRVASPIPLRTSALGFEIESTPAPSLGGAVVERILDLLAGAGEPGVADLARAVADAYGAHGSGPLPGTTHVSVVDGRGMAAALSSTLGSGSGIFRGGTQLNNMLGELDVIGPGEKAPGERLASMMTPTLVLEHRRPRLVIGSAGSVRLAGAIAQVTWRILRGEHLEGAIRAPRLHVVGPTVHLEGGWPDEAAASLPDSWEVVRWEGINLFFGGVQAVHRAPDGTLEAAGDPRRGGAGVVVG
jgi:gamma-glutamyltranspeptidase/glutathione hydrolase